MKIYALLLLLLVAACGAEEVYVPKPKGYQRIELPEHAYQTLPANFPYNFEYSKHAQMASDPHFMAEEFWIELKYPQFKAEIDISYKPIRNRPDSLVGFIATSHKLTRKHSVKASKIEEYEATGGANRQYAAVVFELEGEVPSYFHWYAHDTNQHFVRTALYFESAESADSLKPIIDYLKLDMIHMLNTLSFPKKPQ
jgi:gliding motility-associated lipoprotein GldD